MPNLTPVQWQWVTFGFVLAVTALVVGFDVWTIQANGVNSSISRVFRRLFTASPTFFVALVFWLGILVGHIWLPTE